MREEKALILEPWFSWAGQMMQETHWHKSWSLLL
ncbi:hypothetical protein N879_18665 [Alcaligenes sp. EGD-AK7]|nr:hypothetical protein N879_18665 [Alcaligenes sp. EGD-AK7]